MSISRCSDLAPILPGRYGLRGTKGSGRALTARIDVSVLLACGNNVGFHQRRGTAVYSAPDLGDFSFLVEGGVLGQRRGKLRGFLVVQERVWNHLKSPQHYTYLIY